MDGEAMTTDMDDNKQLVSALADGQLEGEALAQGLRALAEDPQAREAWQAYHLIGDVLRQPGLADTTPTPQFMARLSQRLAQEPSPQAVPRPSAVATVAVTGTTPAANDGVFRWKLVAGFASLAAVAAVGWNLAAPLLPSAQPQLAGATPRAPGVVTTASGPMLRDPRLDELLEAHRQLGGATALQAPAGGLHNAVFEAPAR